MLDNREVYSTVEFDSWVSRTELIEAEKFLIDTYLDKHARTLEGGSGGGKILCAMNEMGFTSLSGFDYVPEFVAAARRRDVSRKISFEVGEASSLDYSDASFDQLIYLQQIICFIEDGCLRHKALEEAYRILRPGGILLLSVLSFEARSQRSSYLPYLIYLRLFRKFHSSSRPIQSLPWLKLGGKFNPRSLLDVGPFTYWYTLPEIHDELLDVGFDVIAIGSSHQIEQRRMLSFSEIIKSPIKGMLYVVSIKNSA